MKIIAIADTHGALPEIPECDMFIHAGDVCPAYNHENGFQANWLMDHFNPWLRGISAQHKIVVAGNHDWIFTNKNMVPKLECHYLEASGITIEGLKLWGSPWTPFFNGWAFNFRQRGGRNQARRHWESMPEIVDILITHGPPYGCGDLIPGLNGGYERVGDPELSGKVFKVKPKIHIFGHVHIGGTSIEATSKIDQTTYYNVSVLNEDYKLLGKPTIIEV